VSHVDLNDHFDRLLAGGQLTSTLDDLLHQTAAQIKNIHTVTTEYMQTQEC